MGVEGEVVKPAVGESIAVICNWEDACEQYDGEGGREESYIWRLVLER